MSLHVFNFARLRKKSIEEAIAELKPEAKFAKPIGYLKSFRYGG